MLDHLLHLSSPRNPHPPGKRTPFLLAESRCPGSQSSLPFNQRRGFRTPSFAESWIGTTCSSFSESAYDYVCTLDRGICRPIWLYVPPVGVLFSDTSRPGRERTQGREAAVGDRAARTPQCRATAPLRPSATVASSPPNLLIAIVFYLILHIDRQICTHTVFLTV